ncbi:TolB family protein [Saccharospirillum impatiens]|uniref:TolB family protein n=1 Tax=Saccharospirillum impatiens TaxID=169438 RepID=UPI0003F510E9|nr:hypothetical protein [Saccharospirillum impatiens]
MSFASLLRVALPVFICLAWPAHANDQDRPDRDWQQLSTAGFDIVYPQGLEAEARYVANRLGTYWPALTESMPMHRPPRRIPIVLSAATLTSNGYVRSDPIQSVFYNQPSPLGGLEWFDLLTVHEGRHLVQYAQPLDTGVGRIARVLAGENGPMAFVVLFYPNWLLEGDAVAEETRLTSGGRGRVASFDLWLRTHELTGQRYSYDRIMLGTGFEHYPRVSPYDFGYLMTSYLRREQGSLILDEALAGVAEPGAGFTFDGRIRALTGNNLSQTYRAAWDDLHQRWQGAVDALDITPVTPLWAPTSDHWQSLYPVAIDDDRVLAVDMDVTTGSYLSVVSQGQKYRVAMLPAAVASGYSGTAKQKTVSYANDRFCWAEGREHPRFNRVVTRDLYCHDIQSSERYRLTDLGDITSAGQAETGHLLAHRFSMNRSSQLDWLSPDGQSLRQIPLPQRSLAFDMSANEDGEWVFALLTGAGTQIMHWSDQTGVLRALTQPVQGETWRSPVQAGDWVLYTSDRGGIDSLWALNPTNGERYRISQRPFGNYFIAWDETRQRLISTDYQANGHALVEHPWRGGTGPQPHWVAEAEVATIEPYVAPLSAPVDAVQTDADPARAFRHATGDWLPNSWLLSADNQAVSLNLHNTNLMNTLTTDLTLGYNWEADIPTGALALDWRRHWPVVSVSIEQYPDSDQNRVDTDTRLAVSVPLQQTRGTARVGLEPSLGISYLTARAMDSNASAEASFVEAGLSGYWAHQAAPRDLQAPVAIAPAARLDTQLDTGGYQLALSNTLHIPGFADNHHISISGQWQRRDADFTGSSRIPASPVFDAAAVTRDMATSRANYQFSLGPVDAALGRLLYLRSLTLAFDARVQYRDDEQRSAYGVQLSVPSNVLRNSRLRLVPTASVYYRPEQADWVPTLSLTLGG